MTHFHPVAGWRAVLSLSLIAVCLAGCGGAQARLAGHLERGQSYLADGNLEKARVEFRNALQIDPNSGEARYFAGTVAERMRNVREAAGFYQSALDADPKLTKARASLARIYLFSGAPDRAAELIDPALAKGEDADLLTVRSALRLQRGDTASALADASRAVELAPSNETAIAMLAAVYRRSGDDEKARKLLVDAVERAPKSSDLRQVLVQLYSQVGDQAGAGRELRKLIELHPAELSYRYQLALLLLAGKQVDAAEKVLREGIAADPTSTTPKLALVDFLGAQRSKEKAEAELASFVSREPDNFELRLGLGKLYEANQQTDKADAVYRDVVARDPSGSEGLTARNRRAVLKLRSGKLDEASALADEVLKANPRDNDALILRGNIALAQNRPDAAIADLRAVLRDQPNASPVLRALARAHLANGDLALAEETLRSAVESNPKDVDTRIDLVQLLLRRGGAEEALSMIEKAVLESPDNVGARVALFQAQSAVHQTDAAARTAEDIKLLRPDQSLGFYLAGVAADARKQRDLAVKEYEHALALQPDATEPLTALVRADLQAQRPDAAIARLRQVIDKVPANVMARNLLGEILVAQKKPADALAVLKEATARAPSWWPPYRTLAAARLAQGDRKGAIASYQQGLRAIPNSVDLTVDLARLYEEDGRADDAIRIYEDLLKHQAKSVVASNNLAMLLVTYRRDQASLDRAMQLSGSIDPAADPALVDTQGWVRYKRGEYALALPLLEQTVSRLPDSAVVRYHLAMTQLRAGQLDQARENLDRALKSGVPFTGSDEARATLDSLKKKQSG